MANYSVNPAGMQAVESELTQVTQQLDTSLSTLQASVQRFTAANNGQAPDAYARAQALWDQGQREMHQALTLGQQRLGEITNNYVSGDNRGAAVFSG
ncbi:WXG100 family type VII secretion target [Dactylosporangium sp. CA-233914]|uniref:WXG100 family type VII secretion target n=1 Tax=Dactylosporangium sp. CA-233914 TaxID=3239934 RepID=UPI003D9433E2